MDASKQSPSKPHRNIIIPVPSQMSEGRKQGGIQRSLQWCMIIQRHASEALVVHHLAWPPDHDTEKLGDLHRGLSYFLALCVFFPCIFIATAVSYSGIPENPGLLVAYCSRDCQANVKLSSRMCFSEEKFYSMLIISAKDMGSSSNFSWWFKIKALSLHVFSSVLQ